MCIRVGFDSLCTLPVLLRSIDWIPIADLARPAALWLERLYQLILSCVCVHMQAFWRGKDGLRMREDSDPNGYDSDGEFHGE